MELHELTIHQLQEVLRRREASAVEVLESVWRRIEAVEPVLGAYITLNEEEARKAAQAADAARARGEEGALLGIPIGIKDIILTAGLRTTAASRLLENFLPPYDATVTARLREAGAVITGKLNMDEFGMGSTTENSGFHLTRNPWDLSRVPGGSSGGSAAAVGAELCAAALGTDTGGSIRQPAACCGVVGLKPTYGRVSRYGVIAFASSLDQVGPITRDVTDAAILLQVIAGYDPRDSTSVPLETPDYRAALSGEVKGLRVGVPREYFGAGLEAEVEAVIHAALRQLEELGCVIEEVSLPHTEYCVAAYYIIAPAEASSNLARYDGVRFGLRPPGGRGLLEMYKKTRQQGFGPEVKRRILIGTYTLSAGYYDAYYLKACRVRTLIKQDFEQAFEKYDALAAPVMPTAPFKLGEKLEDPLAMYLSDVLTLGPSLAGLPGLSVPCGFTPEGLPVGLQLLAPHFREDTLLRLAYAYEQATDWHKMKPPLKAG